MLSVRNSNFTLESTSHNGVYLQRPRVYIGSLFINPKKLSEGSVSKPQSSRETIEQNNVTS